METTIQKWGNSHAVRIPKAFLEQLELRENEKVDIELGQEGITIKKLMPNTHILLKEHLEKFCGKPLKDINLETQESEMDWGTVRGEEEW